MPIPRPAPLLILLAATCLSACHARDADREPAVDSAASPSAWYTSTRTLDLTGDGRVDTVKLQAVGTHPDSMTVTLTMIVDGEVKHRNAWESSYELALADSATRSGPRAPVFLRARLDSVLASVTVEPLDAPGVRLMAEDSATLATLAPRPTHRISFAFGYETVVRMVWDAPRARFVSLWSCC